MTPHVHLFVFRLFGRSYMLLSDNLCYYYLNKYAVALFSSVGWSVGQSDDWLVSYTSTLLSVHLVVMTF